MADVQLSTRSASVKTAYEANADTNAFTDAEKARLAGLTDPFLDNVKVGDNAGAAITDGTDNTLVGDRAGEAVTTGSHNTMVGSLAGTVLTTGFDNTCVGSLAGSSLTTGSEHVMVGRNAGRNLTTGLRNVVVGADAGELLTTGSRNTGVGFENFHQIVDGSNNVAVGANAGNILSSGNRNTLVGENAGALLTTADDNVLIGRSCGDNATTGHDNIVIGAGVDLANADDGQKLIIGNLIFGDLLVGNPGTTVATGGVGIGVRSPTARLHVDGAVRVGQYATGSLPSAVAAGAGSIAFDATLGAAVVSDGSSWAPLASGDGGATTLDALDDVTVTGVADNEVLAYNSGTGGWVNQTAAEAGLATAAQGTLAASALQPAQVAVGAITPAPAALNFGGGVDGQVLTKQADGSIAMETLPTGSAAVTSVFTRTGAVVAAANDYAVAQINGLQTALDAKQDAVMPPVSVTGSRSLALSDAARMLRANSASAIALTIPANATVAFPQGATISVVRWNAAVSFLAAGGVTILKPSDRTLAIRAQYEVVTLWQENIDVWVAFGGLAST